MNKLVFTVAVTVSVFVLQWNIWQAMQLADQDKWYARTATLASDLRAGDRLDQANYTGHPAMAVLLPAAVINNLASYPIPYALRLSITLLNTASIAGLILLCYLLMPKTVWWLAAGGLLTFHPLYVQTAPTTAVIAPLTAFIYLLGLYIHERGQHHSRSLLFVFAVAIGAALATRWFISFAMFTPLILFLYSRKDSLRNLLATIGIAAAVAIFLNPLMWYAPLAHLQHAFQRAALHASVLSVDEVSHIDFALFAPVGIISFLLAIYYLFFRSRHGYRFPTTYLRFSWYVTAATAGALFLAQSKSLRYFFPLAFLWDAYLPLMLADWVTTRNFLAYFPAHQARRARSIVLTSMTGLLVGAHVYLLLQALNITGDLFRYTIE